MDVSIKLHDAYRLGGGIGSGDKRAHDRRDEKRQVGKAVLMRSEKEAIVARIEQQCTVGKRK